MTVHFEWDEQKRITNLRKHGVDFRDGTAFFRGITSTIPDERKDYGEQRWITFGLLNGTVLAAVHLEFKDTIRIVSMRKANRNEAKEFFEEIRDQLG